METYNLPLDLQKIISTEQAWHYRIIPVKLDGSDLSFLISDLKNSEDILNELEVLFGKTIHLQQERDDVIQQTLSRFYRRKDDSHSVKTSGLSTSEDFLQKLINEAKSLGSSDIHIETYENNCRVRYRIDGNLIERHHINKSEYPSLINKIKIRANLDIAEKRLPQDGRIFFKEGNEKFDIRVSILPTLHGEKIVLRLLSNDATNIDIETLGFEKSMLLDYLEGVKRPHGIVLISGPTGSGKTTTLYATLKLLNKTTDNILTVEDPIEYTLEGVNQVQLKESIGLTFASALRTFLRQDPDVIMLGEIRDGETAEMAIRAALTGHLVLSTIHTNSAWGTISRLADMGVPPFLIASTLNTSVAQRLLRTLCTSCKTAVPFEEKLFPKKFKPFRKINSHFTSQGCPQCYYTGFKGRKAVYEVIPIDHELAELIKNNQFNVAESLKAKGIRTLAESAFELFEKGETTIDEIYPLLLNN